MNKSAVFVGLALVAGIGAFGYQLLVPPEQVGHSMEQPDMSGVEDGGAIAQITVPASLSENAQLGKMIFEANCAQCHGTNAVGQKGVAPPLVHKIYEPSHHSDMAFVIAAKNGVRAHHWKFGNMPRIEGVTDADAKYVAMYVRELQRANGID
ncbi:c-type cytochrome [Pseudaestuariivita atlantica]|uniref:Cytochrome C n=1 Tax=Pseudaestuariivita atlantica TaxID=1317121 RepID=A0A0L1JUD8_9RHOB|nr:cytochrome c [Pseudaestuariivita atlantica]KNG95399.1 cytochrome C [Pseudaestuariivita atlantica]